MSTIEKSNLGVEGQTLPFNAGVNALLEFFEPDIEFTESDIRKFGSEISVRIKWNGEYRKLDVERDRLICSDYHRDWGIYFQIHETEEEKIHYMLVWIQNNKGEREYGLRVLSIEYVKRGE